MLMKTSWNVWHQMEQIGQMSAIWKENAVVAVPQKARQSRSKVEVMLTEFCDWVGFVYNMCSTWLDGQSCLSGMQRLGRAAQRRPVECINTTGCCTMTMHCSLVARYLWMFDEARDDSIPAVALFKSALTTEDIFLKVPTLKGRWFQMRKAIEENSLPGAQFHKMNSRAHFRNGKIIGSGV